MNKLQLLRAAAGALRVRFTGARVPVAARIQVTRRCSLRCAYCRPPDEAGEAMSTDELTGILEQLAALGCSRISLSGGEPMLRDDIGTLVNACADLGMAPEMNSSGTRLAERIDEVARLELLKLSLDGPPEVHDKIRGRDGSYREVLRAVDAAQRQGIRTVLVTTITRHNVDQLDHVLELARERGTLAAFQPLKPYYKGLVDVEELLPEPAAMRTAVTRLREARQGPYGAVLRNSPAGLQHIARWPDYRPLRCWAGRIFCIVGADGTLYPCDRTRIDPPLPNCLEDGVSTALSRLPDPDCEGCGFCGALELNLALAFDWQVASTILRLLR